MLAEERRGKQTGSALLPINDPDFRGSASAIIPQNTKNTNTPSPNISDSTLTKMQQKIESYTQKTAHKENLKHQNNEKETK